MNPELPTELRCCHTAEEFFALLDVPYDPRVLNVNRLHILRHFAGQLDDLAARGAQSRAACHAALVRSYQAFSTGSALDHRLFKVLRDHAPTAFVPTAEVRVLGRAS